MAKKVSKFFRIGVEGDTCDGRVISAQDIQEMAETFDPRFYGCRINLEHLRGILPDGIFKRYGDVAELKAEKIDDDSALKGKWALFAKITPTDDLIAMNKAAQKVYTSMEIQPNFANTGKCYLVGLAETDALILNGGFLMDYNNYDRGYAEPSMSASDYMTRTYRWMAGGLLVTFAMAYITATTPLIYLVDSLYFLLTIGELALVFMLSARVQKMSIDGARAAFFGYAILNGMVLSYYFLMFSVGTLVMAFLATAVYFGLMAVYGTTTHKDLTGWGPRLMMALVAMIVTSLVGALFGFGFGASVLYCGIGLVVFMLLTAYDTQKLRQIYAYYAGDAELAEKASIYGALTLYLDFINIFLYVVRLLGMNSRSRNN